MRINSYLLAPTAFRAKARGTEYCHTNNLATGVWRTWQRSSPEAMGRIASRWEVVSPLARVYLIAWNVSLDQLAKRSRTLDIGYGGATGE